MMMRNGTRRRFLAAIGVASLRTPCAAQDRKSSGYLVFQSRFWPNLHHFLRAESRRMLRNLDLESASALMPVDDQMLWKRALAAYSAFANQSLIFEPRLVRICNQLACVQDSVSSLSGILLDDADAVLALNQAARAYRENIWARHTDENEAWIGRHAPYIRSHETRVRARIEEVFLVKLSKQPLLIDLCRETGPTLAYTVSPGPRNTCGHTVLAPQKNTDRDTAADTVFHELWHTIDQNVINMVNREAARLLVTVPEDLWHALGLYTTCQIVQDIAAKKLQADYKPKLDSIRMFSSPEWKPLYDGLEAHWMPYLLGRATRESALTKLVLSVAKPPRGTESKQ